MLRHGWNLHWAVVISLTVLAGSNSAIGLAVFQASYNLSDSDQSTESAAVRVNGIANPIQQNGLENVPPDVMKAIYPNGTPSAPSDQTPSFFNQTTSPSIDGSEPVRFNDSLVTNSDPRIVRKDEPPHQAQPQAVSIVPGPTSHPNELRNLLEQPLSYGRGDGAGDFSSEVKMDPYVTPTNYSTPTSVDRGINPRTSALMEPVRTPVEPSRMNASDSRMPVIADSDYRNPGFENANSPTSQGQSLQEILDASNRENQQQPKNSFTLEKPHSPKSQLKSGNSPAGIDLGRKIREISIVLCLVLGIGIGFIFIAKLWFRNQNRVFHEKGSRKNESSQSAPRIHLTTSLRLDSKSTLHLVEAANQRVLVATDLNGIKSVVALTPSFETELDSMLAQEPSQPSAQERKSLPKDDFDEIYSPVPRQYQLGKKLETRDQYPPINENPRDTQSKKSTTELETEMRRQLAELLGGQAFKDVFMQQALSEKR